MRPTLRGEMGDGGIVILAISQGANKKNKSPVTVPDSRCSITEPLDELQLCSIISHLQEVPSGIHACVFCQIAALSQRVR